MKIEIWTVGKAHDADLKEAIAKYEKRISHYAQLEWKIIKPSKKKQEVDIRKEDSQSIEALMTAGPRYLLLDERGAAWDNSTWSKTLQNHAVTNPHPLVYIRGGAYGVTPELRTKLTSVSVSPLILPHMIMRLILVEQLYRSFMILNGGQYHHT